MISFILFLLSVFCIIYYGIVIAYSGLHTAFVGFWLFSAVLSALAAVILQSSFYLSLPFIIHLIIKIVTVIILAFFLIILLKIISTSSYPDEDADYLIVLGAIVRGEKPSNALRERIQTAYNYLSTHKNTIAVLTGYRNSHAKISQGKCMQNELRKMGIPAYRLLVEDHAHTTEENLKFSRDFMTQLDPEVCIISSDFHLYRTMKTAKKYGFKNVKGIGAKTPAPILIHCYIREIFAIIKSYTH
ncbi:MAG: YdcF family protein [Lachnospiraceae bacterium]|nr:YdcF family protein [Lachnospiraceae bacterium]